MLVRIICGKCIGIQAVKVTVEVNIDNGIGIHLVGLADIAVKESLLRTTTALQAQHFRIPGKKIVINLAPADLHKSGSGYDLPIALGIIAASDQKELPGLGKFLIMGELGLDGSIRDIPGALPLAELAAQEGLEGMILPARTAAETAGFGDIRIYGVKELSEVLEIIEEKDSRDRLLVKNAGGFREKSSVSEPCRHTGEDETVTTGKDIQDFADIIGQEGAKRGMEIAAAGAHNIIMIGPPGAGKTSLAKALAGILPPMTEKEALVTGKIYSIAGKGGEHCGLARERPFRAPHYTASLPAIIGGGCGDCIMPGEVSLAHYGVLFLDELGQIPRSVLEALRGPLEDRKVVISRLRSKIEYPASFILAAASNPCPCGYWGEGDRCTCTPSQRLNYMSKLSGPIMDRIDIQVWLHPVSPGSVTSGRKAEPSEAVAARVRRAREIQEERFRGSAICTNAEMTNRMTERFCPLDDGQKRMLSEMMARQGFSMRAYYRILRLARTIADLEGEGNVKSRHLMEAAGYRFLDKDKL